MSVTEVHSVFVRYHFFEGDYQPEDMQWLVEDTQWLVSEHIGYTAKDKPKRAWSNADYGAKPHDFARSHEPLEKALSYAQRIGKIVKCGRELLDQGYVLEVVLRTSRIETTVCDVVVNDPTNPMVQIALAAL